MTRIDDAIRDILALLGRGTDVTVHTILSPVTVRLTPEGYSLQGGAVAAYGESIELIDVGEGQLLRIELRTGRMLTGLATVPEHRLVCVTEAYRCTYCSHWAGRASSPP